MRRYLVVIGLAAVLAVSGGIGVVRGTDPAGTPLGVAGAAGQVVVPGSGQDVGRVMEALQATLRRVPGDDASWANLALVYVEQARLTGLPSYYAKADAAVTRSRELRTVDNFRAQAAAAALAAARHDFTAALDLADQALQINPRDSGALLVRVDALTELGRYDDQLRALRVADRRQPGPGTAARYAYAYELRGDLARAAAILRRAAAAGSRSDAAYLLTQLADVDRRRGRLDAAARHAREALRADPDYLPAMVSRARLQTAREDLTGALTSWEAIVRRLPLPEYLTELGELYEVLGRPDDARAQYAVVRTTITLLSASGVNTDLDSALFDLDHGFPQRALAQSRAEWGRRHSIHVADTLAWALHRAGQDRKALRYARLATSLGTPEARLWLHRGEIEASLGMTAAARTHLRQGLATDPGTSPWQQAQARAVLEGLRS